jgi:antitoxin component YwqK of YwqJK toxin-antitoxin module
MEGSYKNDKKDGVFKYYHENGKLEKEISYKDGDIVL